ncbi:nuclear transport factor 2 family protein [Nocardioides pacificus]
MIGPQEPRLSDRDAILEQLATLAWATDQRDWALIGSIVTDDAVAYGARGRANILATMQAHIGGVGPTQHLLGNHRVSVDGDTARSLSYGRVHHVGAGPMTGSFFECMGDYDDRWVRMDGRWRLTRRVFDMQIMLGDFAVLRPADA